MMVTIGSTNRLVAALIYFTIGFVLSVVLFLILGGERIEQPKTDPCRESAKCAFRLDIPDDGSSIRMGIL